MTYGQTVYEENTRDTHIIYTETRVLFPASDHSKYDTFAFPSRSDLSDRLLPAGPHTAPERSRTNFVFILISQLLNR